MASWRLKAAQPPVAKTMPVSVRDASAFAGDMGASNGAKGGGKRRSPFDSAIGRLIKQNS